MGCKPTCHLCDHLVISTAVNFDPQAAQVIIGLPEGTYENGEKYCIVVAQAIPASATVNAAVVATIGTATRYPVLKRDGTQMTAASLRTRTKYSTRADTSTPGGSFRLIGRCACAPDNTRAAL